MKYNAVQTMQYKQRKNVMVKQKDAVFNAVSAVRGATEFGEAVELTKEERGVVQTSLIADFQAGNIAYQGDATDTQKLTSYVSGLVSNWLRKDKRLNGNVAYIAKNPGTRTGSGDEALKAMRTLLSATTDLDARDAIQVEIDKRVLELKPRKVVDVSKLPESLRHLANQS
jgi:hypothetical protein